MRKFWKKTEGFTLVELIVVIAILGILAGVGTVGYSGYVKKANMAADEQLASNVKNALLLAHYNGDLDSGSSVVIYHDDEDVKVTGTADAAMSAAFGDNYKANLRLSYSGWAEELGVAADSAMMEYVHNSRFNADNLDNLLGQVQTVVNAAANYLPGVIVTNEGVLEILGNANISIENGVITEDNARAAANAYVFDVAKVIGSTDTKDEDEVGIYTESWGLGDFSYMGWDPVAQEAASYARALALATYVDEACGTDYAAQIDANKDDPRISSSAVANEILGSSNIEVQAALSSYADSGAMLNDAMAFLAYMDGVTTASDSLLESKNLHNDAYFNDGTVLSYVNNYMGLSDVLTGEDTENGAFAFYYDGNSVACLPLDY